MYTYKIEVNFKHKRNIGTSPDYTKVFTFKANNKQAMIKQLKAEVQRVLYDLSYGDGSYKAVVGKSSFKKIY